MQPAIVLLVFAEREPEAVAGGQVADNSGETGAIVFDATDMHGFAAALLGQTLRATGQAEPGPANQRLTQRQEELVERSHVNGQRIEGRVLPDQDLFGRV